MNSKKIFDKANKLVEKLKQQGKKVILDIGCGHIKRGNIGMDCYPFKEVDIVWDVNNGLPFKDNTIDKIICFHVIEHLKLEKFNYIFEEMWRVAKPDSEIHIKVPHFSCGSIAWADPTHIRPFSIRTFTEYLCIKNSQAKMHFNFDRKFRFKCKKIRLNYVSFPEDREIKLKLRFLWNFIEKIANSSFYLQQLFERKLCYLFGGFEEIDVILEVVK